MQRSERKIDERLVLGHHCFQLRCIEINTTRNRWTKRCEIICQWTRENHQSNWNEKTLIGIDCNYSRYIDINSIIIQRKRKSSLSVSFFSDFDAIKQIITEVSLFFLLRLSFVALRSSFKTPEEDKKRNSFRFQLTFVVDLHLSLLSIADLHLFFVLLRSSIEKAVRKDNVPLAMISINNFLLLCRTLQIFETFDRKKCLVRCRHRPNRIFSFLS